MKRRQFVQIATAAMAAASIPSVAPTLAAGDPIMRVGPPRFTLGLAAYSLRKYFSFMKGKPQTPQADGEAIDMVGFLDYCVAQNVQAAELTSYFFPPDADAGYFLNLKREAFVRGVTISGTAIGNNFTVGLGERLDREIADAKAWIDRAAMMGAPHIRFFAGTGKDLQGDPARIIEAADALNECAQYAATKGIFLGVENHGNLTSGQMLEIMGRTESPWVGINLDTGNFWSDDPYADLEKCAPYAVNVQVKVTMRTADRKPYPADLPRVGKILKESGYQGFVVLEYEDETPYENIPKVLDELREALA